MTLLEILKSNGVEEIDKSELVEVFEYYLKDKSNNTIDLGGMNFSKCNCNVNISGMIVRGVLRQNHQTVEKSLLQQHQKVKGDLYQNRQTVNGLLYQGNQTVEESLFQDDQKVNGDLYQLRQNVGGNLFQYLQTVNGTIYQDIEIRGDYRICKY